MHLLLLLFVAVLFCCVDADCVLLAVFRVVCTYIMFCFCLMCLLLLLFRAVSPLIVVF